MKNKKQTNVIFFIIALVAIVVCVVVRDVDYSGAPVDYKLTVEAMPTPIPIDFIINGVTNEPGKTIRFVTVTPPTPSN